MHESWCLAEFIELIFHIVHTSVDRIFDMINIPFDTLIFVNNAKVNANSNNCCDDQHNTNDREQHIQSATATAERSDQKKEEKEKNTYLISENIDSIIIVIKETDYKQIAWNCLFDISCRPLNAIQNRPNQIIRNVRIIVRRMKNLRYHQWSVLMFRFFSAFTHIWILNDCVISFSIFGNLNRRN